MTEPKKIAVITGASSGLGREFVKQLGRYGELSEIWAIARREEKLLELTGITECPIKPIPADLTEEKTTAMLRDMFRKEDPEIAYLINAAGFGRIGMSTEIPAEDNEAMIDLNCRAAVAVTDAALPYMRKGSRILEICSTAAFQPLPGLNVYAATKAFLMSYTKSLHYELLLRGIHVTAVCPYWIKDTEFIPVAQMTGKKAVKHFPFTAKPPFVVSWALFDSDINLWVSTPGPVPLLHRMTAKFIPHFIMVPVWDLLRRI